MLVAKWYSETCQTSKMELFANIISVFHPLTIFVESSILNALKGSPVHLWNGDIILYYILIALRLMLFCIVTKPLGNHNLFDKRYLF